MYLPKKRNEATEILGCIFKLHNNGKEYGGETVFKYLVSELVDNIYEHSGLHVPLTLFYVHGDTTEDLEFRFAPENGERHPVNYVLRAYREQFFNGVKEAKPTVLMATCNINDSRQSASIENPGFHVVYRKGLAGGQLAATGTIETDF